MGTKPKRTLAADKKEKASPLTNPASDSSAAKIPANGSPKSQRSKALKSAAHKTDQPFGSTIEDLRDAIEFASDVIYTHDLEGNFTSSNATAVRILGYSYEETLRMNITNLLPPEELPRARQATAAKVAGKPYPNPYPIRVKAKDGHIVHLELSTRLILKDGLPVGVQGIGRDISERILAEAALHESESKFRAVAESAPCAIVIFRNNKLLYVNPAATELTGYSIPELLALDPFWKIAAPEFRAQLAKRVAERMAGSPLTDHHEFRIVHKNSAERWMDFTANAIEYEGQPAAVVLIFDITERKRAEQALAQSEQLFRTVIENSSDVISVLNTNGIIQYESPSLERLMGFKPQELVGKGGFDLVHPDDRELIVGKFKRRLSRNAAVTPTELRLLHKDGHWMSFEAVSNLLYENGQVSGMLVSFRDIADRIRQQAELRVSEERFRQLFERNMAGVFRCTTDGKFVACNEAFAHIFGYDSPEELEGQSSWQLSVDEGRRKAFIARLRKEKQITDLEDQLLRKDGAIIWVLENVAILPATDSQPEMFEGTLIDITERKRTESKMKVSEERYRQLFERNLAGVYVSTLAGELLDCNDSFAHIYGYASREEVLEVPALDFYIAEEDRSKFMERLCESKVLTNVETLSRRKDGAAIWVLENVALIEGNSDAPDTIQGTLVDITERKYAEQALIESESKFRAVADTASSAIYIHNNQRFLYVNRACEEISGYTSQELMKMNPFDLVFPADQDLVVSRAKLRVHGDSTPDRYEYRILVKNKEVRWVDFSASTIQFGGEDAIIGTAFDITERKRVEQMQAALYRIAERANAAEDLGEFFAAAHHIIGELIHAKNFYIALFDAETKQLTYPYYADEQDSAPVGAFPLGKGLTEYVLRLNRPVLMTPELMEQLKAEGEVDLVGSMFVDWIGAPLKSGNQTFGVIVTQTYSQDVRYGENELDVLNFVSQHLASAILRKRNEEALRDSEQRHRSIVQSAVYGIYRSSTDDTFLEVNPAIVNMLAYDSAAEVLALSLSRDVYADENERVRLIQQYGREDRLENIEVKWKRKDGKPITVRLSGHAVKNPQGEVEGFEMITEDVTERRALEEQLRQSQKMEAVGRLAGGVAHDFNNLLTVIKGYSELMLDELKEADPLRSEVEEIKKAADRAAGLTRQLLAFSRQQVLAPKVLDLNSVVGNMDKLLKRLLGEDISLYTVLEHGVGRVKADPGQVEQVIMNLAVNARDAMPRGGKLTVETANVDLDESYAHEHMGSKPGRYVMLAVSDTGSGMTQQVRQRIFEPFFTTTELGKGTGLGLSTVYGIVKQSDGYIWVYSEVGLGTSFKVYLPRVDAPAELGEHRPLSKAAYRGSETVLLVEDEDGVRALVRQVLHKHGYTVLEARHGGEALLHCERHRGKIELLLTDVVLEQMSGTELSARLAPIRPDMKVLYISGYTDDAIVHHGVLNQGTHFLQKPFTTEALAKKIRHVLDSE
ncbi:MAG: multi-sensor hybrid histidine kinase [Candidatus Angelobacter sp.]|nr:multi-sensor hybrid histidine kinase [Candidatus Angelobacter sp.]